MSSSGFLNFCPIEEDVDLKVGIDGGENYFNVTCSMTTNLKTLKMRPIQTGLGTPKATALETVKTQVCTKDCYWI